MCAEQGQTVRANSFRLVSATRQLIAVRLPDAVFLIQPLGVGAGRRRTTTAAPLIYYSVSLKRRRGSTQVKGYRAPSWISGVGCGVLGLERYEAAFRENAIDADVLRDLTDQDLEKLGVLLGDRRRLLRAAALDGVSAAASSPAPVPSPVTSALISAAAASPTSSTVEVSGERRHVTAMFCDLVGREARRRGMARSSRSLPRRRFHRSHRMGW